MDILVNSPLVSSPLLPIMKARRETRGHRRVRDEGLSAEEKELSKGRTEGLTRRVRSCVNAGVAVGSRDRGQENTGAPETFEITALLPKCNQKCV